ncbi:Uma2 family endonuclease [Amycolatopsis endophytica]|uniref:Uma2 family endonuclease n=1 Tax=Amycolatopsis endophytica TaxID=860233 RepID=A0A853B6A7_9PSEU|nr:Uma2 family endonuclease [Amycolatopsis endophytica]NYI90345.1 Uma2 family endonuclease [Amycolatopsis endophytica]
MAAPAEPVKPDCLVPWHDDPWTVEEALELPEERGSRIELVDGALLVSPAPKSGHQRILQRLQIALLPVLPSGTELLPGINVRLPGQRLLIPDLAVVTTPDLDTVYYRARDVLLAAEIVSPSSRMLDRVLKRQLYAEAGVPFYLVVDPAGQAVLFELAEGEYRESARGEDGRLSFTEPFEATLDFTR